jgi:peptide/nickel transport system substrate-binding protein
MHRDTAEVVQENLNAIGNHITLALPDWATRVSLGNQARFQFAVNGTVGLTNDPDFLTAFFSSGAPSYYGAAVGYSDPAIDRLLNEADATSDQGRRRQLYGQLQRLALADSPYTFLTWREQGYAYSKAVGGFTNLPGFLTFWSGYSLEDTVVTR